MPTHTEPYSDAMVPRSRFYDGPYGRMFRRLPPHVPTINMLKGRTHNIGLPNDLVKLLNEFLKALDKRKGDNKELLEAVDKPKGDDEELKDPKQALIEAISERLKDQPNPITELLDEMKSVLEEKDRTYISNFRYLVKKLVDLKTVDGKQMIEDILPQNYINIFNKFKDDVVEVIEDADPLGLVLECKKVIAKDHLSKLPNSTKTIVEDLKVALQSTSTETQSQEAILRLFARTMFEGKYQSQRQEGNNPDIPAGYTYFCQLITHDLTFDPISSVMRFNDPEKIRNFRTPKLDLDSLYGGGPLDSPFLYEDTKNDRSQSTFGKFLIGKNEYEKGDEDGPEHNNNGDTITTSTSEPHISSEDEDRSGHNNNSDMSITLTGKRCPFSEDDLPRNPESRALIGDPRNDENVIVSQLQLAFMKFHNKVLDDVIQRHPDLQGIQVFQEAQRIVQWHYQWVIVHDLLPKIINPGTLDKILNHPNAPKEYNLHYYEWNKRPFIPVEFSIAAFRFGHSMIRDRYNLNYKRELHAIPVLPLTNDQRDNSLIGFRKLKEGWTIQWDKFLKIEGSPKTPKASRTITPRYSRRLQELSEVTKKNIDNLAILDLLRGYKTDLPSGQAVARAMQVEKLLDGPDVPLLFYILREAEETQGGRKLGPVGGRIVAEVLIGLLVGDPRSYLSVEPKWTPTYPKSGAEFELRDILAYAEVPLNKQEYEKKEKATQA